MLLGNKQFDVENEKSFINISVLLSHCLEYPLGNFLLVCRHHPVVPELVDRLRSPELEEAEAEVLVDLGLGAEHQLVVVVVKPGNNKKCF